MEHSCGWGGLEVTHVKFSPMCPLLGFQYDLCWGGKGVRKDTGPALVAGLASAWLP